MKTCLSVKSWTGDLFTELACWQGVIRKLSRTYDETHVIVSNSKKSIYTDFATKIIDSDDFSYVPPNYAKIVEPANISISFLSNQPYIDKNCQEFCYLGGPSPHKKYTILADYTSDFTKAQWAQVIYDTHDNLDIGWVSPSSKINGTHIDDSDFNTLLEAVNDSEIVIGKSGLLPLLAGICGVPFITWVPRNVENLYTNHWNPMETSAVCFLGTPSVKQIKAAIQKIYTMQNYAAEKVNDHE